MSIYKKSTSYLGIPVVGKRDRINPDVELKKYTIIENMLIAGTQGVKFVVFDDGEYSIQKEDDSTFEVVLRATGATPSAHGIVNGAYFFAPSEVKWTGLKKGFEYYLYLKGFPKTFEDKSCVRAVSSQHPLANAHLLMAHVDLRGGGEVNPYPDGKFYSDDVARHSGDNENPHGRTLTQDELIVKKKLVLPTEDFEVQIGDMAVPASAFSEAIAEVAGRRIEIVDFESFGQEGGVKSVSKRVMSVQVHRRVVDGIAGSLGEIGVGYFGQDNKVDLETEFAVYNTGDAGVPLRAMVLCG